MRCYQIAFVFLLASGAFCAESFWPGKVLTVQEVATKWGKQSLDINKFRQGDSSARAAMTYDLLNQQAKYVGKPLSEIRKMFGNHDGHYFNDWIPAYIIDEGQKKGEEIWQIVFLPDKDRKVSKIIVHKNCCE